MLSLRRSPSSTHNRVFKPSARGAQSNADYVQAHSSGDSTSTELLLLGGVGAVDFRLRVAQAHARADFLPSAWSHVAILGPLGKNAGKRSVFEVPLSTPADADYPPAKNGVVERRLANYDDPHAFPNIALLRVPVPLASVQKSIEQFCQQRSLLDALEMKLAWLAFAWGVGSTGNPLFAGLGVPSAVFVEYVVAAAGYDLVPGFPSRSSCPEAIWQATRWWHEFPRATSADAEEPVAMAPISGVYEAEQYLVDPGSDGPRKRRRASKR